MRANGLRRVRSPAVCGAGLLIAFGAALTGCKAPEAAPKETARKVQVPVETTAVVRKTFVRRLALPGRFEPTRKARIAAEIPGRVIALPVAEGQSVDRDALLIRLDPATARAQAQQASGAVEQAVAQVELARSNARRMRRLAAAKVVDQARMEQAVGAEKQAKAALLMARAAHDLAQSTVRKLTISAPFAGIVTTRNVELGEVVAPGPPLVTIADYSKMKLLVDVPERSVSKVRVGQQVDIVVRALDGQRLQGAISRIPMHAHGASRTFPVEVEVGNVDGKLRAGMMARAELILESLPDQVVVPLAAVVDEPASGDNAARSVVFVVEKGKAHRQDVTTGSMQGDEAVVTQGLQGGERLVITGQRRVVDGDAVEVVREHDRNEVPAPPPARAPTAAAAAP